MDYAKYIAGMEAARADKHARMKELRQVAMDEGRSLDTAEAAESDSLAAEIQTIEDDLKRVRALKSIEDAEALAAKPVDDKASKSQPVRQGGYKIAPSVKDTTKLEPGISFARYARVKALAHTGMTGTTDPVQIAQSVYPGDEHLVSALTKSAVATANTLTGSDAWAKNLITDGGVPFADFVEYLRPRTLVGRISDRLRRLPFDTPVLIQASAGAAKWVKEGAAKPLTKWTYSRTKMPPLKVAAIAAATKETLMRASVAADQLLRDELARAVGETIDTTFLSADAAVTDEAPAGILNGVGALSLSGGSDADAVRADVSEYLNEFADNNLSLAGAFWVMPERVAIALSLMQSPLGQAAFPGVNFEGGTFFGLPVFVTSYATTESDGSLVALIKGDEVFLGDEGGVQVSMSDQASLLMDDSPSMNSTTPTAAQLVSLWQTNSVAFLVERFINFQRRRTEAVVWGRVLWEAGAASS